jgi:hypothetical protein
MDLLSPSTRLLVVFADFLSILESISTRVALPARGRLNSRRIAVSAAGYQEAMLSQF